MPTTFPCRAPRRHSRRPWAALVVLCLLAATAGATAAQDGTGDVAGRVSDAAGRPLADASVVMVQSASGDTVYMAMTGSDGRFLIAGVATGVPYEVHVERAGFVPARTTLQARAGTTVNVEVVLSLSVSGGLVVVTALQADIDPLGARRRTIARPFIDALPLFSRDFLYLTALAPGFAGNPEYPSAQGQPYWAHNVVVDGASHYSKWRGAPRAFASGYALESIDSIDVHTSVFSAELADALASVTEVTTRAGGDRWVGSAFLYLHDAALDAVPAFTSVRPSGGSQQIGASAGGPLGGQATRIWSSYEARRLRARNVVASPAATGTLVPDHRDEQQVFVRLDHQGGAGSILTARYNGQRVDWHHEPGGLVLPGSGTRYVNDAHAAAVTYRAATPGSTLGEIRVQGARYVDIRSDLSPSVFVSRAGYSIEGGLLGPGGFGADPEDTWEGSMMVSARTRRHVQKAGAGGRFVEAQTRSFNAGHGAYYFAGAPALFRDPFLFVQGVGGSGRASVANPRSAAGFLFAQDDWTLRSGVTVSLGARYDIDRVWNLPGFAPPVDRNNFQPRVGVGWDVTGSGRTVVRGGAGLYAQQHLLYPITRVVLEGPAGIAAVSVAAGSPLMPVFPSALPSLAPGMLPPLDVHRGPEELRNPYAIQAMAGVEHRWRDFTFATDVVTLDGRALLGLSDANAPASVEKPQQRTIAEADATRPRVPQAGAYRNVIVLSNMGRSWYRALQVKAEKAGGASRLLASYTLGRARDMANYRLPEDSRNIEAERGPADADVRHNLTTAATWILPESSSSIWSGWSVAAVGTFRSGRPYTVSWGDDRTGTGQHDARPGARNSARTDGYQSLDAALTRRVPVGQAHLDARLEVFNLFSTINYNEYVGQLLSPSFGQPVSAFPRRRLQFSATLRF